MRFPPVNLGCKIHDRTADGENDLLYDSRFSVCIYVFSCYRSVRQNYGVTRKLKFRRLFLRIIDGYIPCVIKQALILVYIESVEIISRKLPAGTLIDKTFYIAVFVEGKTEQIAFDMFIVI